MFLGRKEPPFLLMATPRDGPSSPGAWLPTPQLFPPEAPPSVGSVLSAVSRMWVSRPQLEGLSSGQRRWQPGKALPSGKAGSFIF